MKNPLCLLPPVMIPILVICSCSGPVEGENATAVKVDVGLILDLDSPWGKMSRTCILMALDDFYANNTYRTKVVPHIRDAKDSVEAASAAIDLLSNVQVQAIVGPQQCTQADFVIDIGTKAEVPILSPASSPSLLPKESPFFVRTAHISSWQAKAIAAIVVEYGWREVAFIYEDNDFGSGMVPSLSDALLKVNTKVSSRIVLSTSAEDDRLLLELYKLMSMQTRVFIVHTSPPLASRLFQKVHEAEMMSKGYVWITTELLTSFLGCMEPEVINLMQGVTGLRPHVPKSIEVENFNKRWNEMFPKGVKRLELNVFGLWAYDSMVALAMAVENANITSSRFKKAATEERSTDLATIGTSVMGPKLLAAIQNIKVKGLSGDFHIVNGQLKPLDFEIVNINGQQVNVICYWTETHGISNEIKSRNKDCLKLIKWPGVSNEVPKGWVIPTRGKKLRIGVPQKEGFKEFINIETNKKRNATDVSGFTASVFEEAIKSLPYAVPYEFFPFEITKGNYTTLIQRILEGIYDVAVGDITITEKRSNSVDFTLPFTESGVSMIVPFKPHKESNDWIFLRPLQNNLWFTTGAFFIYTGLVVWILEHRVNKEFRGPPRKQVGMIVWYSFSTLVFAHKEKIMSNLARFVILVWVFVVLVLSSSYTANLASMLTVQKLRPTATNISKLINDGKYIGYQSGSFVEGLLKEKFNCTKLRPYITLEEYNVALSLGSENEGVAAIVDEAPYVRLFLATYCKNYTDVGTLYKTAGFGFAFQKGSPLVADVSRGILSLKEGNKMKQILDYWFGDESSCPEMSGVIPTSNRLALDKFTGLFLIVGTSLGAAIIIFVFIFLNENKDILVSDYSVWQKLVALAKTFDELKEIPNNNAKRTSAGDEDGVQMASQNTPDYQDMGSDYLQSQNTCVSPCTDDFPSAGEDISTTGTETPADYTNTITIQER